VGYETLRLCRGRAAFEAIPEPKLALDLRAARDRLEAAGVGVTDARVMLICRLEAEATLARDGRLLIKTDDPRTADSVFRRLDGLLGLSGKGTDRSPNG
jgi:hypothetical protein